MSETEHDGFRADEGAYETFARGVRPLADTVAGAGQRHLSQHLEVGGDGFSEVGVETGLAAAYGARMRDLHERLGTVGGNWSEVADAARATDGNYRAVEAEHDSAFRQLGESS